MSADALALLSPQTPDTLPQGILAAAEVRERRARQAQKWWRNDRDPSGEGARYVFTEARPAHALAAVRLWRMVVNEMEVEAYRFENGDIPYTWTAAADEARAYLGGAS